MKGVRAHIESVVNGERCYDRTVLERLLSLFAKGYGGAVRLKELGCQQKWFRSRLLPCPVLSVGNLTAGGTGKTPLTLYMARLLSAWGYRPAVISRGYKGGREKMGGIVCDGKEIRLTPRQAGDEPFMMATELRATPVLVGRDRYHSGHLAVASLKANAILLDDGFQHRKLGRQIDLVLVDHHRGFGNGHLLPRGPLREPFTALSRAHALIITGVDPNKTESPSIQQATDNYKSSMVVFRCRFKPTLSRLVLAGFPGNRGHNDDHAQSLKEIFGKRVFGFSGLGDNQKFYASLESVGCRVTGFQGFPDHHWYTPADLAEVQRAALAADAELIATTQKDAIRIGSQVTWPIDMAVLGIEPDFGHLTEKFHQFIRDRVTRP